MRLLFAFFLIPLLLFAALDDDIIKQRKLLEQSGKKKEALSEKLQDLASRILVEKNTMGQLNKKEDVLEDKLKDSVSLLKKLESEQGDLKTQESKLHKEKSALERKLIEFLAKDISFSFVTGEIKPFSEADMVNQEIFEALNEVAKKNIEELKENFQKTVEQINNVGERLGELKGQIAAIKKDKTELETLKKEKNKLIATLGKSQKKYKSELNEIAKRQDEIGDLLESLKIKKREQDRKGQEKTLQEQQKSYSGKDVRKLGSSYMNVATETYKGKKTISPLEAYQVINKFGPYFDPVYNIKIFNESVTLKPQTNDAKVRSVLDGVVVFARKTSVMDKVVIIEHKNNLHTIYGYLSKIAPTIKPGITVKEGYVVGRVDEKLMFEVTRKNRYIDPLELFN